MEFGQPPDELPEEAKGEDLMTLSGRLRAAMMRAGKQPMLRAGKRVYYAELKSMLEAAGYAIGKQTVHNWFRPSATFIEHSWLFKVAKVLDVSPEWLATGEGSPAPPKVISDDCAQVIEMWDSLKDERARTAWIHSGHTILDLTGQKTRAAPFAGAHADLATQEGTKTRR